MMQMQAGVFPRSGVRASNMIKSTIKRNVLRNTYYKQRLKRQGKPFLHKSGWAQLRSPLTNKDKEKKEMARLHFQNKETNKLSLQEVYLLDNYLSYRSKGLLGILYMINRDINFKLKDFADMSTDSYGGVKASFKELETLGYISRKMLRDKHGRFITMEYTVHARPRKRSIGGDLYSK